MNRQCIAGVDGGNWATKIAHMTSVNQKTLTSPTSVLSRFRVARKGDPQAIQLVDSPSLWCGQGFFLDPYGDRVTFMSDTGKIDNALPLFLCAMWDVLRDGDTWSLVVCVPRADYNGENVSKALTGTHTAVHQGKTKTIHIRVLDIVNEGMGAIRTVNDRNYQRLLTEIGGRTVNTTVFDMGCLPYVCDNIGAFGLVNEIANSPQSLKYKQGRALSIPEATTALQEMSLNGVDYTSTVHGCIDRWFDKVMTTVRQRVQHHLCDEQLVKYASGGVCQHPYVASRLEAFGYSILSEPVYANAIGNLQLAKDLWV